ncbi:MAG: ATP/GTP-binding protein [Micromonosporaceae bacterium]|nr:ATP/GTP-binding protein [Micromonosporaceae bacterium]
MADVLTQRFIGTRSTPTAVKILVAGGLGVGKTALVSAISEIAPLRVPGTADNVTFGDSGLPGVETRIFSADTLDFGRITIDEALILYLFDAPEQNRRWVLRDEVALGALGAVVLADPSRLEECVPVIDYFERQGTPYVVAVSDVAGPREGQLAEVRRALGVDPWVPVAHCDPYKRESSRNVLITLVEYARALVSQRAAATVTA